jgi:hypothetical protein
VNFTTAIFSFVVAALVIVLIWALRGGRRKASAHENEPDSLEQVGRRHSTYLPVIRQALTRRDCAFLQAHGYSELAERLQHERRRVALSYLASLHEDFERLVRLGKAVAVLAPQVAAAQELERAWFSVQFECRYRLVRVAIYTGAAPLKRLDGLSHMVSELAVRMETALSELGERAAAAAKLASSLDRRGMDVA